MKCSDKRLVWTVTNLWTLYSIFLPHK